MKKNKGIQGRHLRRKRLSLLILFLCLPSLVTAGGLTAYSYYIDKRISASRLESDKMIADANKRIADAREEARQREVARKEAASFAAERAKTVQSLSDVKDATADACNAARQHADPTRIDVIVNKTHCIKPLTYEPSDLVTVYGAKISAKAADGFSRMYEAAQAAGMTLAVTSSYRSYENQITTYQYWVSVSGYDGADTYSARPGYSEHQTGFAIDVAAGGCSLDCFGATPQYAWLQQHAWEYGFVQRYYAGLEEVTGFTSEEWHYRYVGVEVAKDMREKDIKTLEEYWGISGGQYERTSS